MTDTTRKASIMIRSWLFLLVAVGVLTACERPSASTSAGRPSASAPADHPYVGMWVTADGRIRQELLPDGRYEEARDGRERAYTGVYTVTGDHIDYVDDTGFTADGTFVSRDVLHHSGMVMHRESRPGRDG